MKLSEKVAKLEARIEDLEEKLRMISSQQSQYDEAHDGPTQLKRRWVIRCPVHTKPGTKGKKSFSYYMGELSRPHEGDKVESLWVNGDSSAHDMPAWSRPEQAVNVATSTWFKFPNERYGNIQIVEQQKEIWDDEETEYTDVAVYKEFPRENYNTDEE